MNPAAAGRLQTIACRRRIRLWRKTPLHWS